MRRVEIVGNHSVEQDLLDALEKYLPQLYWTKIPTVQGRGMTGSKLGDAVWPQSNFLWFSVCREEEEVILRRIVNEIRNRHPTEGIFLASTEARI